MTQQRNTYNPPANPFARGELARHANAGAIAIESERAVAEVQSRLIVAMRQPRDQGAAYAAVMEACKRRGLAEAACYSFPRGKETVSGPSIRLAEELARCWGNIDYGIRELSRKDGVSEMEAYAWDLQTNTRSSQHFTVRHIRDRTHGSVELTSERDIYELTANMGGRRLRARILAVLPPDLIDDAVRQCVTTLAGGNGEPLQDRVRRMIRAFDKLGVSVPLLEQYTGHSLDRILPDQLAELLQIHNSIRDGMTSASDWFSKSKDQGAEVAAPAAISQLNQAITGDGASQEKKAPAKSTRKKAQAKPKAEPAPEPEPTPEPEPEKKEAPTPEPEPAPEAEPPADQQAATGEAWESEEDDLI